MPILVHCTGCQTKMNAPDNAGGKKVKCPKCAALLTVPGPAVPVPARSNPAPAPVKKQPSPKEDDFASALGKLAPKKEKSKAGDEDDRQPAKKKPARDEDHRPSSAVDDLLAGLPEEQAEEVRSTIGSKERILWAGKPVPKVFAWRAVPIVLVGLLFLVFGVGAIPMLGGDKNAPVILRFGVPVALLVTGACLLLSPLFALKRAGRTFYALTNKRGLVWNGGWLFGYSFTEYSAMRVSSAKRQNSWMVKGAGDSVFKEEVHVTTTEYRDRRGRYMGSNQSVRIVQYGFMGIPEVGEIERLIRREITAKVQRALEEE